MWDSDVARRSEHRNGRYPTLWFPLSTRQPHLDSNLVSCLFQSFEDLAPDRVRSGNFRSGSRRGSIADEIQLSSDEEKSAVVARRSFTKALFCSLNCDDRVSEVVRFGSGWASRCIDDDPERKGSA